MNSGGSRKFAARIASKTRTASVCHCRFHMNEAEGELIARVSEAVKPAEILLEIGFAYGVSTLFACEALNNNQKPCRHIVIDPNQSSLFGGIGLINVERSGYRGLVDFVEEPSEIALPRLLQANTRICRRHRRISITR